jgi:cyanophycinase
MRLASLLLVLFFPIVFFPVARFAASPDAAYRYIRIGNPEDVRTIPAFGIALMGGGSDLDEAFRWLCDQGRGGDFLVLRAAGDDDYNAYVAGLCKLNSIATLIIPSVEAAKDPKVVDIIGHAEVIFIAGGDQARYVNFWRGTPVQDALNAHIAAGKPIGGTSAGLAVLGEFVYAALGDAPDDADLASANVLPNPYHARVTLVRDFLKTPGLQNVITDTHFTKRDRMGRSLVFLARIMQDGWSKSPREIAVDEKSAVLVDENGKADVIGAGRGAYFIHPTQAPAVCSPNRPLTISNISVYRAGSGAHFDLRVWRGEGGNAYSLSVEHGVIHSTQAGGAVY